MTTRDDDLVTSPPSRAPLLGAALVAATLPLLVGFGTHEVGTSTMALPVWLVLVTTFDLITLVVLVAQYRSGAGPRVLAATWAFVFSAVVAVAMLVVVQRALSSGGASASEAESIAWLYVARHLGVPVLLVLALTPWRASVTHWLGAPDGRTRRVLLTHVVVVVAAGLLTWLLVARPVPLPSIIRQVDGVAMVSHGAAGAALVVSLLALVVGLRGVLDGSRSHGLEAWAIVALTADTGDALLTFLTRSNQTVAWYGARGLGLVGAVAVLGALLREGNQLQVRTRRYAEQLLEQNASLNEAQALREHLVAVVSQDMRNPITGLQGYLELLDEGHVFEPAQVAKMHARSRALARRLVLMTEDLLASVTASGMQVVPRTLDLGSEIEDCVAAFPEITVLVRCPPDLEVVADPQRLQQVLANLVDNAHKHGAEPIRIRAYRLDECTARIAVSDAGDGVDPDLVPQLFERYTRGSTTTQGSGLGLSVARSLVEAHGGSLDYDAAGNAFVVLIPAARQVADTRRPPTAPEALDTVRSQRPKAGRSLARNALTPSVKSGPV